MFAKLYWILPLISALTWLGMLLGMLISWAVDGKPYYPSEDPGQHIPYISDVGAFRLKPLFIAGSCVTVVFLDLGLIAERWLRHEGKLAPNTSWTQKSLSLLSILAALGGAVGLICLTRFDTYHYPNVHDRLLVVFMAGYILSAIFICAEFQRLGHHYRRIRSLHISFWLKLFFIIVEVGLAIGFGVCSTKNYPNTAAILEWTLAFIFTFYDISFIIDLLPAVKTKDYYSEETVTEMAGSRAYNQGGNDRHEYGYEDSNGHGSHHGGGVAPGMRHF